MKPFILWKRLLSQIVPIGFFVFAIGVLLVSVKTGSNLPGSGGALNSNQVEDLLELVKIAAFRLIPGLALVIAYLSIILWIRTRGD